MPAGPGNQPDGQSELTFLKKKNWNHIFTTFLIFGPTTFLSVTQTLCLITLQPQSLTCHRQLEHQLWEDEEQRGCSKGKSSLQSMCRLKKALVQISTVDALISRKLLEYLEYTTRSLEVSVCMLVCYTTFAIGKWQVQIEEKLQIGFHCFSVETLRLTSVRRRKTSSAISRRWGGDLEFCGTKGREGSNQLGSIGAAKLDGSSSDG